MLTLFNLTVNFLSKICNCSILLCSATQPCLEEVKYPMMIDDNIISEADFKKYSKIFKRNSIVDSGHFKLEDIPSFVADKAKENQSLLVVCNKKAQA